VNITTRYCRMGRRRCASRASCCSTFRSSERASNYRVICCGRSRACR
jgi:hypothetical protein